MGVGPIDGTVNYLHGAPLYAIFLSLVRNEVALAAVIDLPFLGTQYSALRSHGSYANNERLHVSARQKLDAALVSIDQYTFGENAQRKNNVRHSLTKHLASHVQRIRMLGTSAIDLAWTAQGRLDACIMLGNKPWDTSAGVLIAREAGARVL
ncbi:MAG: inositol monophosphatase family protein, partial [Pseudonocardiaceae bacterium]